MLKRLCASFFIACLIFSVSLVHASADIFDTSSTDYVMDLYFTSIEGDPLYEAQPVHINGNGENSIIAPRSVNVTRMPLKCSSNYYEPKPYDRTVFVSIGLTSTGDAWFNNVNEYVDSSRPTVYYTDSTLHDVSVLSEYPQGVERANTIWNAMSTHGEIFNMRITVPANSNVFKFDTSTYVVFSAEGTWTISSFGGYIVDTADDSILAVVEQILANTSSIDGNVANIVTAINDILIELRSIGADTSTIVTLLEGLTDLSERELNTLENVASNVEAIYYFLTEELKDKAGATDQVVADTATKIENQHNAEDFYMTNMDSEYKKLQLDQVSLSGVTGGLSLVSALFQDVWNVIGKWQIVYTFPFTLGIALLVIGRIGKSERKESTSEEVSSAPRVSVNPRHNNDNRGVRNG